MSVWPESRSAVPGRDCVVPNPVGIEPFVAVEGLPAQRLDDPDTIVSLPEAWFILPEANVILLGASLILRGASLMLPETIVSLPEASLILLEPRLSFPEPLLSFWSHRYPPATIHGLRND